MNQNTEKEKGLHPRNLHNDSYDFKALIESSPELSQFVTPNKHDSLSIDFSKPEAVVALNKALLAHFYAIKSWELPKGRLCPPIPGRVDYIHHIADLLATSNTENIPIGHKVRGLDVGVGANCIYPIIGNSVYGWKFVGTDIDSDSLNSAKTIIKSNKSLAKNIKCRFQKDSKNIFRNTIMSDEFFDFTICNPPFHSSIEEAMEGADKKILNLYFNSVKNGNTKAVRPQKSERTLNFGGKNGELWCPGGELAFIKRMAQQSSENKKNCYWFTTIVSKKENLAEINTVLESLNAMDIRTIDMQHGQKRSRILAWTFLTKEEQKSWSKTRWNKK